MRTLGFGVAISVCVHIGVFAVMTGAAAVDTSRGSDEEPVFDMSQPNPLQLGIAQSNAVTVNWVGFEAPTEHSAPESTVEQAALTPQVGQQATAAAAPLETPETQEPAEAEQPTQEVAAEASERATPSEAAPAAAPVRLPLEAFVPLESTELDAPTLKPSPLEAIAEPEAKAEVSPEPQAQDAAAAPAAPSQASAEGAPGEADPRESDAAALKKAIDYRPGRPIAAEGLEITPVRPRYSITTRAIARPRDPHVTIEFDSSGRVKRAFFVKSAGKIRSTGFEQVDGPLLDAIYRWKAKGKDIDELEGDETVAITIRVMLGAE
jgi:hypothetical protein